MEFLKKLLRPLKWKYLAMKILIPEYRMLIKEYGCVNTNSDQQKLKFLIIKKVHVIEKGLSLKECRPGFGVPKVLDILKDLDNYTERYDDQELLVFSLSIIKRYVEFNKAKKALDINIEKRYMLLDSKVKSWVTYKELCGGETILTRSEIMQTINFPFFEFVKSRHSIRTFTGEPVSKELLKKAIEIASYTPSACNRQPWGTHVFTHKETIIKILDIQTGARQFKDMISALIVVTATRKAFFEGEINQWYINGGMYSMSLIYAIHSLGLGCIPLNLGIPQNKINQIWELANLDMAEAPIILLAIGQLPEEFKVANSCRFPISDYTTFD